MQFVADLKAEFAVLHEKPLVLAIVDVQWGATTTHAEGIDHAERPGGIAPRHFAVEAPIEKAHGRKKPVLVRFDNKRLCDIGRNHDRSPSPPALIVAGDTIVKAENALT
jgi:hypothetical protein